MAPEKHTLLVTGGSGFLGGNVIDLALKRGYNVKAAVRSEGTARKVAAQFPGHKDKLSFVIVPDITKAEAYGNGMGGVTGIIHSASPFVLKPDDNVKDLFEPAVQGVLAILDAAQRWGASTVKQVVLTSSHAAVYNPHADPKRAGYVYSEKDWNPITWDEAKTADGVTAYCASKAFAEKAAWEWMEKNKPAFTLTTITPPWIFGPYATELSSTAHLTESVKLLYDMLGAKDIPPFDFGGFADVREVAEAHIRALEVPEAAGQRFWIGQNFQYQAAVDAAREAIPELRKRLPEGRPGFRDDVYTVDGSKTAKVLGIQYRPLEVTVKDTYTQLLHAEQVEGKA